MDKLQELKDELVVKIFKHEVQFFEAAEKYFEGSKYEAEFRGLYGVFLEDLLEEEPDIIKIRAVRQLLRELIAKASPNTYEDKHKGWTRTSDNFFMLVHSGLDPDEIER